MTEPGEPDADVAEMPFSPFDQVEALETAEPFADRTVMVCPLRQAI